MNRQQSHTYINTQSWYFVATTITLETELGRMTLHIHFELYAFFEPPCGVGLQQVCCIAHA